MTKIFNNEEVISVMWGTKCSNCRERISLGILRAELNNGTKVFFCGNCHLQYKLHPINSRISFKGGN